MSNPTHRGVWAPEGKAIGGGRRRAIVDDWARAPEADKARAEVTAKLRLTAPVAGKDDIGGRSEGDTG